MQLSLIIVMCVLICFIVSIIIRKYIVKKLLQLKNEKRYDEYLQQLDATTTKIFVQRINRSYMKLNGYKALKDYKMIDQTVDEMLSMNMNSLQKEDFYSNQCHYYIIRKDEKYIKIFMKRLEELENKKYGIIANYAYEVIINDRNDLISEIDQEINYLKGINLGIACYLIGLQYLRLKDQAQAKLFFQSAVVVTKYSIYDTLAKQCLKELEDVEAAHPEE